MRGAIGWAFYLASSWTWCIGMMLPALLTRDHGWPGFAVFAAPNIIGAAAMGWVLTREASRRFVRDHRLAVGAFTVVTVFYQAYFLGWLFTGFYPVDTLTVLVPVLAGAWALFAVLNGRGRSRLGAGLAWGVSVGVGLVLWERGGLRWSAAQAGVLDEHALWILPISSLGFLACPYLDVTFHTARQGMSATHARAAFTLGFGVLFAAMIALTYAARDQLAPIGGTGFGQAPGDLAFVYAVHAVVQLAFTARLHADTARLNPDVRLGRAPIAWVIALGISLGIVASFWNLPGVAEVNARELAYRAILGAYGVVFPAYMLIALARRLRPFDHAAWSLLGGVVAVAAPFGWLGFVERESRWLVAAAAVVVAGGVASALLGGRGVEQVAGGAADER